MNIQNNHNRLSTNKTAQHWCWRFLALILVLALLLSPLASSRPAAASTAPAGLLTIDSQDPHRLLMDGKPFYLAGYYPNIGALTHDQYDYENYYKILIDMLAVNRINYMRGVFDMGQTIGSSMSLYQRTGPGTANDGKPKYDLKKFNQDYFDYWRKVITYAQSKGIVVQLVINDSWHNKSNIVYDNGGDRVWGMKHDYYNGANNINGLDASDNTNWHSPSHASFEYHKQVIRKVVDNLGDLPNIVYEISNENNTNANWERQLADYLTSYEASTGRSRHLVMPRDLPNHDNAGGKTVDPVRSHTELVSNFSKNKVLIADNDGGGSSTPLSRRNKAWAALTAGAHMSYFHSGMFKLDVLVSSDASDGMRYIGLTTKFMSDFNVDLRGMIPSDSLVSSGWALAKSGERFIVYLRSGGSTTVSNLPSSYTAHWFDPRTGASQTASGGPTFTTPDSKDWVLYIVSSSSAAPTSAAPSPTPTNAPVNPTPTNAPVNPTPTPVPLQRSTGSILINFQPAKAPTYNGYLVDDGSVFGNRDNGYSYGWNKDNRASARDRNKHSDQRYDTFIHLQKDGFFTWEIALPSGNYEVRIISGDPSYYDSFYKLKGEEITVLKGTPTSKSYFIESSFTVTVSDGRLNIRPSGDAVNTKIAFIEITPVP
jgi:hypothetical protein